MISAFLDPLRLTTNLVYTNAKISAILNDRAAEAFLHGLVRKQSVNFSRYILPK
jgi:hypothetical protein